MEEKKLSFIGHLEELRSRIIKSILAVIVAGCLTYNYIPPIIAFLTKPVGKLVFLDPLEAFNAYINIAIFGGLFIACPFIFYQIARFLLPAMEKNQRKYAVSVSFTAFLLFAVGCWAGLFIVMPQLVKFLLSFATQSVVPMITIGKYVSFATFITVACGIIFETPLIIVILAKIGIIKPAALARRRREVIVAAFIIAAVITPTTDVVTQTVLAVILWLLYEVGIGVAKIVAKEKPVKIFNNESH